MSLLVYLFGTRLLWTQRVGETTRQQSYKQERTGTRQGLQVCHGHTFAASRHSITLTLKWEVAALFISTQLLAITKTAPLGSFTSVALRGLNSINLAC